MSACEHLDFDVVARIDRIIASKPDATIPVRFVANVQVQCTQCKTRFAWMGLHQGLHPTEPRTSVDDFELRAPIAPDGHMTSMMAGTESAFPSFEIRRHRHRTEGYTHLEDEIMCKTCGYPMTIAGYCTNKLCSRHGRTNDYDPDGVLPNMEDS
jgi:hypothetical protein